MSLVHSNAVDRIAVRPTSPAVITGVAPKRAPSFTLEPEPITSPKATGTIAAPA
jgi:hypothetical protein